MTNQELDHWIAKNVMGWTLKTHTEYVDFFDETYIVEAWQPGGVRPGDFTPTTNLLQALDALEEWLSKDVGRSWSVESPPDEWMVCLAARSLRDIRVSAATFPLAICKALNEAVKP